MNNLEVTQGEFVAPVEPDFESLWQLRRVGTDKVYKNTTFVNANRLHASFGRTPCKHGPDKTYMFGLQLEGSDVDIPDILSPMHKHICTLFGFPYNQIVVNWFENGHNFIPRHKDYPHGLDLDAGVVTVSLMDQTPHTPQQWDTQTRELVVGGTPNGPLRIDMGHKTIVRLRHEYLTEYTHGVPRTKSLNHFGLRESVPRRISVSFRRYT